MSSQISLKGEDDSVPLVSEHKNDEYDDFSFLGESDNPNFKSTTLTLAKLSWPVIVTFILELLPGLVNTIAVGRLGEDELASVSLASMFCNVTGISVGFGIASAMDTLCSQVFGSNNKKKLGVIVQRALLIEGLICIPIIALWIFSEPILLVLGQDERVSELTGVYCQIMIIGLYPLLIYEVQKKFLQSQGIVFPQMYIAIVANLWNIAANYLFIYVFDWGFSGAPLARSSTYILLPTLTTIYIVFSKTYVGAHDGCTKECLQKWGHFMKLGIPGMLMMCLEWWAFEILAIFAGLLGTTELAVQAIVYNMIMIVFFIPYGTSVASSIIVGNGLGKGWTKTCFFVTRVSLALATIAEVTLGILIIGLKDYIPLIFTKEEAVIDLASDILPIVAAYQIFDGIAISAGGILRGSGKQYLGAGYNFIGYFFLGLSLSACLSFLTDLRLVGLWLGFGIAIFISSIFAIVIVLRIDWEKEVENAKERVFLNVSH